MVIYCTVVPVALVVKVLIMSSDGFLLVNQVDSGTKTQRFGVALSNGLFRYSDLYGNNFNLYGTWSC